MAGFEESLQQCYLFIKLLVGYEVRRAGLTRRVLVGECAFILEGPCGFSF